MYIIPIIIHFQHICYYLHFIIRYLPFYCIDNALELIRLWIIHFTNVENKYNKLIIPKSWRPTSFPKLRYLNKLYVYSDHHRDPDSYFVVQLEVPPPPLSLCFHQRFFCRLPF